MARTIRYTDNQSDATRAMLDSRRMKWLRDTEAHLSNALRETQADVHCECGETVSINNFRRHLNHRLSE